MSVLSQERARRLRGLALFSEVADADLSFVAETGRWQTISAGEVLLRAGEEGADLLVTTAGRFEVAVGAAPARTVIANVEAGELLGEAVLYRRSVSRSADVAALTEGEALRLSNAELEALIRVGNGVPRAVEAAVLRTLARRIQNSRELVQSMLRGDDAPASSGGFFARLKGLMGR